MGIFDFLKKKKKKSGMNVSIKWTVSSPLPPSDPIEVDEILPFEWISQNAEFVNKIKNEYNYFLNLYNESDVPIRQKRANLKSLIYYIYDARKLCEQKGELFEEWFVNYLCDDDFLSKKLLELEYMDKHFDELQLKEKIQAAHLPTLKNDVINIIKNNNGILQTDLYKHFPPEIKQDVSEKIYFMAKEGIIQREKSERTYKLKLK